MVPPLVLVYLSTSDGGHNQTTLAPSVEYVAAKVLTYVITCLRRCCEQVVLDGIALGPAAARAARPVTAVTAVAAVSERPVEWGLELDPVVPTSRCIDNRHLHPPCTTRHHHHHHTPPAPDFTTTRHHRRQPSDMIPQAARA